MILINSKRKILISYSSVIFRITWAVVITIENRNGENANKYPGR